MQYYNDKERQKKERWVDFDINFEAHPHTGNLILKKNEDSVNQSIVSLVQTSRFERLFQPQINSRVRQMLFEPMTPASIMQLKSNISDVILQYEPRVKLIDVQIMERNDQNKIEVYIVYTVIDTNQISSAEFTLKRLR